MNASEDDKIKAMMDQSTKDFDQSKYVHLSLTSPSISASLVAPAFIICDIRGSFFVNTLCLRSLTVNLARIVVNILVTFSH